MVSHYFFGDSKILFLFPGDFSFLASSSTECYVLVTVLVLFFFFSLYAIELFVSIGVKMIKKYPTLLRLSSMICFVCYTIELPTSFDRFG